MKIHGGQIIARALKAEGVDTIFTLSGGHIVAILDGCVQEGIKIVDVRHEQAAAHAAEAYTRLTGKLGVAVVTAGPGVTDSITASGDRLVRPNANASDWRAPFHPAGTEGRPPGDEPSAAVPGHHGLGRHRLGGWTARRLRRHRRTPCLLGPGRSRLPRCSDGCPVRHDRRRRRRLADAAIALEADRAPTTMGST